MANYRWHMLSLLGALGLTLAGCAVERSTAKATAHAAAAPEHKTWVADNGNGTYTNPLFYEEFSDPDVIRVNDTYYLTGTTMHTHPGLYVMQSKDLVNWELASYCFDRLDLAPTPPAFRLENNQQVYGQGVWAPCIRYNKGTFYVINNVNGQGTHVYRSTSAKGPWKHNKLTTPLYDLGVLFDDDDRVYVAHGTNPIYISELNADITDVIPNSRRQPQFSGRMGEGSHFYKVNGKYYLVSAIPGANTDMVVARSDSINGPWETKAMVNKEHMGVHTGYGQGGGRGGRGGRGAATAPGRGAAQVFAPMPRDPNAGGGLTIHQGGIVDTPSGEWWTVIMQDHRSLGRVSCLAPITWEDGWPMIGVPGNLAKAPRSWIKPNTGHEQAPKPAWVRDDNFGSPTMNPLWQWNHIPDDTKWSLTEKPGVLRLHSLPAQNFWWAKNTLTQRSIGPESTVTVELDASGMKEGDVAGLALLNQAYGWVGVARTAEGMRLQHVSLLVADQISEPITSTRFWFRAHCNYDTEKASFFYSTDGKEFKKIGGEFTMLYQLVTFQGIRYSLFHYNTGGSPGGIADFDNYTVDEPRHKTPLPPGGKTVVLSSYRDNSVVIAEGGTLKSVSAGDPRANSAVARFGVHDLGKGGVALWSQSEKQFVTVTAGATPAISLTGVTGLPGAAQTFQWVQMQYDDIMLMSHVHHRYLKAPEAPGAVTANTTGTTPDHKDGSCFAWKVVD